jgi:hypothetical protein
MDEREDVRSRLAAAGIQPPEDDMDALVQAYAQLRKMAAEIFAVDEARYESPALHFDADPAFTDESW